MHSCVFLLSGTFVLFLVGLLFLLVGAETAKAT
jgi:hypothetical protein